MTHQGNRWTPAEDNQLRQLIAENTSTTLISAKLMRSSEAIRMRMFKLRIQDKAKSSRGRKADNTKSSITLRE
jgi:hypothetical protein